MSHPIVCAVLLVALNGNLLISWFPAAVYSLSEEEIVDIVNNYNTSWVARTYPSLPKYRNPVPEPRYHQRHRNFLRSLILRRHSYGHEPFRRWRGEVPKHFDARQRWRYCDTVHDIHDQGNCGSCWAIAVASAISDRICIKRPKLRPVRISPTALLTCTNGGNCRDGHDPYDAWRYYVRYGVPTGGFYNTHDSCQPYIYPGLYNKYGTPTDIFTIPSEQPECSHECIRGYNRTYNSELFYGERAYIVDADEQAIMTEMLIHGPVVAIIETFEDFDNYRMGIYEHIVGKHTGYHAVRVLGWGEEGDQKYWICANSWSRFWGERGTFRVKRGVNEVMIEEAVSAALPYSIGL